MALPKMLAAARLGGSVAMVGLLGAISGGPVYPAGLLRSIPELPLRQPAPQSMWQPSCRYRSLP